MVLSFASWVLAAADALLFRGWVTGNNRLWGVVFFFFSSEWIVAASLELATLHSMSDFCFLCSLFSPIYPFLRCDLGVHRVLYSAVDQLTGGCRPAQAKCVIAPKIARRHNSWLLHNQLTLFFLEGGWGGGENDTSEWHICFGVLHLLGRCASEPQYSFATHSITLWCCLYFCSSPSLAFVCCNLRFQ